MCLASALTWTVTDKFSRESGWWELTLAFGKSRTEATPRAVGTRCGPAPGAGCRPAGLEPGGLAAGRSGEGPVGSSGSEGGLALGGHLLHRSSSSVFHGGVLDLPA